MGFIEFEASQENQALVFSDDEDEITNDEMEDLIDEKDEQEEDLSFYIQLDPENIEHYHKFPNQTRNPKEAVYEDNEPYFGNEDTRPELYDLNNREFVSFDKFKEFEKSIKKFKEALKNFGNSENYFFDAVVYGIMF